MFKSIIKIGAATILFAGVHSLLASRSAKRKAAALVGEKQRNALYRPLYNAQSLIAFGALLWYGVRLPDRELYRMSGATAWAMRIIQFYFLLFLFDGARQIGFLNFAGLPNLLDWITGKEKVRREPEGQVPALGIDGQMKAGGPFRFPRHPLNFGMLQILWLMLRMTANLAAFNLITTVYLVVGSMHEEKRLKKIYGQAYEDYRKSGINFFIPSMPRRSITQSAEDENYIS